MLTPEMLETYRRMTPGERLKLTFELMQGVENWMTKPCEDGPHLSTSSTAWKPHCEVCPLCKLVAQPRRSLQFSGFQGRALEPVGGDQREVPQILAIWYPLQSKP